MVALQADGSKGEANAAHQEAGVNKQGNVDTSEAAKENKEVRPLRLSALQMLRPASLYDLQGNQSLRGYMLPSTASLD